MIADIYRCCAVPDGAPVHIAAGSPERAVAKWASLHQDNRGPLRVSVDGKIWHVDLPDYAAGDALFIPTMHDKRSESVLDFLRWQCGKLGSTPTATRQDVQEFQPRRHGWSMSNRTADTLTSLHLAAQAHGRNFPLLACTFTPMDGGKRAAILHLARFDEHGHPVCPSWTRLVNAKTWPWIAAVRCRE